MDSASVEAKKTKEEEEMDVVPRSSSVLSKGSVVERLFKMATHATKQDRQMADQKYQSMNDALDGNSTGTPPVWEEEIFVTCASFGDIEDGEDQDETSLVGSIRIMDGDNAMITKDQIEQLDVEALKDQDGFCSDNLDMFCISKDDVIDDTSQVMMDSASWEGFVDGEKRKEAKKSRFGWFLNKSKEKGAPDSTHSVGSNGSANSESSPKQDRVEMVLCGSGNAATDGHGSVNRKKSKKRSSSWYPRLVRRTRMKKKMMMEQKHGQEETRGLIAEDIEQMDIESLAKYVDPETAREKDDSSVDIDDEIEKEDPSVSTTEEDLDEETTKDREIAGSEIKTEQDSLSHKSTGDSTKGGNQEDMPQGDEGSVASSLWLMKPSATPLGNDSKSVTSTRSRELTSEGTVSSDAKSVFSQKSKGIKSTVSLCSQRSRKSTEKTLNDDSKSVSSQKSKPSKDAASACSQRSRKSSEKSCIDESKSVLTHASKKTTDKDAMSVSSQRSKATASIKEVVADAQTVASQKSTKLSIDGIVDTAKSIVSVRSVSSKQSLKKKQADEEDAITTASNRSSKSSVKNVPVESQKDEEQVEKAEAEITELVEDAVSATSASKVNDAKEKDNIDEKTEASSHCPKREEGKEEMKAQPLRRFVSELIPSRNRRVKSADQEEEAVAPVEESLALRRICSDIPKTDLARKQHRKKKGSKPFEISGNHLFQPCPSDITEGTDDGECKSILRMVSSRDEAMETINETKDSSERDGTATMGSSNEDEETEESETKEAIDFDAKSAKEKDAAKEEKPISEEKEGIACVEGEADVPEEVNRANNEMQQENNDDEVNESVDKEKKKASVSFGAGVFDYVMRRISSDVLPAQKDPSAEEDNLMNSIEMKKARSEFPTRSAEATKYMENAKPFDLTDQETGSVHVSVDGAISHETEEEQSPIQEESDLRAVAMQKEENESLHQPTFGSSLKTSRSSDHVPAKSLLGSLSNLFGKKANKEGEEKESVEKEKKGDAAGKIERTIQNENDSDVRQDASEEVESVTETKNTELGSIEGGKVSSEGSSMMVCTDQDAPETTSKSESLKDDAIEVTVVPKKKSKGKFKFWKRHSKKRGESGKKSAGEASRTMEESKCDSEEDHSRGGGSQRDDPASDKDSASGREAPDTASVGSVTSTTAIGENDTKPALLMKLKSIPVPESSTPKFERPLTQKEGLKQMQSMRNSDPSEVEKRLDEKLDASKVEQAEATGTMESKKKGPEGILKKNNRFSGGWRKKQKAATPVARKEDDDSNDSTVLVAPSTKENDGGETGFEVMSMVGLTEL